MQVGSITLVANTPVEIVPPAGAQFGVRLLARTSPSGNAFMGTTSAVTTSTGVLIAQGAPNVSTPSTVPATHFFTQGVAQGGRLWIVGDTSGVIVDWTAQ